MHCKAISSPRRLTPSRRCPVGWDSFPPRLELSRDSFIPLVGWLLTASSALFGAPFWFDLLQKFVQLRGTGGKPSGTQ
jgi:hypothetical protein